MKREKIRALLALCLCVCTLAGLLALPVGAESPLPEEVLLGGVPFGVRFFTDGILAVGYSDVKTAEGGKNPAREAGVLPGDRILRLNGSAVQKAEELARYVDEQGGAPLQLTLCREERELTLTLTPATCVEDGRHRIGLLVRDSGAGIGTVTFLLEGTGAFGGLGHGICDGESGILVPLARGSVLGVTIGGVTKGAIGAPGELRGHFSAGKTGTLLANTECGVFGMLTERPALLGGKVRVAHREEVHAGAASVRCTLEDNQPQEYAVEISAIHREATGNKCFSVRVTDEALLSRTGGIVQGMSGSPILQDGRLIGAVTHVLIGDPTAGYGIFIDNMLDALPAELR